MPGHGLVQGQRFGLRMNHIFTEWLLRAEVKRPEESEVPDRCHMGGEIQKLGLIWKREEKRGRGRERSEEAEVERSRGGEHHYHHHHQTHDGSRSNAS
jgi:hypothetical protein